MGKVFVFEHPLMHHKLSIIRDEQTNTKLFREVIDEIGMLMAYEVTKNLPTENVIVKNKGDLIILIMANESADEIEEGFDNL